MHDQGAAEPPVDASNGSVGALPTERRDEKPDGESDPRIYDDQGKQSAEETERQRLERLGRERPAKLKSLTAEIFFCYSVIASQFMAVSRPLFPSMTDGPQLLMLKTRNISYLVSASSSPPFWPILTSLAAERSGPPALSPWSRQRFCCPLAVSPTSTVLTRSSSSD